MTKFSLCSLLVHSSLSLYLSTKKICKAAFASHDNRFGSFLYSLFYSQTYSHVLIQSRLEEDFIKHWRGRLPFLEPQRGWGSQGRAVSTSGNGVLSWRSNQGHRLWLSLTSQIVAWDILAASWSVTDKSKLVSLRQTYYPQTQDNRRPFEGYISITDCLKTFSDATLNVLQQNRGLELTIIIYGRGFSENATGTIPPHSPNTQEILKVFGHSWLWTDLKYQFNNKKLLIPILSWPLIPGHIEN